MADGARNVVIAATENEGLLSLATIDDQLDEPDGTITAELLAGDGYEIGAPASVGVAVTDDDEGPGPIPGISLAVHEGPVVDVGWLPPDDPGTSPITGYVVEYAVNAAFASPTALKAAPDSTALSITGLEADTLYHFRVRAVSEAAAGPWSVAKAQTPSAPVTAAAQTVPSPSNLSAVVDLNSRVTLSWDAPAADPQNPINQYRVARRVAGSGTGFGLQFTPAGSGGDPPPTTWTDPGPLTQGTTYEYKVQALNADFVESSYTAAIQVRVVPTPLGAPTSLTARSNNVFGAVHLSWTAPTDQGGADRIDKYEVERRTPPGDGNGGTWTALTTPSPASGQAPTAWTDPDDLTLGTEYEYRVRARITLRGTQHRSAWSDAVSVTAQQSTAGPPTNLRAVVDLNSRVTLSWDAPTTDPEEHLNRYQVGRRVAGSGTGYGRHFTPAGSGDDPPPTTWTDPDTLTQGTTYEYIIQALYTTNLVGSFYTEPIQVRVVPTPLGAPTSLTARSKDGFGLVHLSWTAPTDQGGSDRIDKYEIERRTPPGDDKGGTWTALTTPSPASGQALTAWTDPATLTLGTEYEYRVRARITLRGTQHHSAWSDAVSVTVERSTAGAPANFSAESGNPIGDVVLNWDAPTDQGGADRIDKYEVERRTPPGDGNGGTWTALTTPSPASGQAPTILSDADGVVDRTAYEYRARSRITVDGTHRYSAWSATASATASRIPLDAPINLRAASGDAFGSVHLRWRAPTSGRHGGADRIDRYEVERRTPPGDGNGGVWAEVTTPSRATGQAPTAWTDPATLTLGTEYEYRVRARITRAGIRHLSGWGNSATVTVSQNSLGRPTNPVATATTSGVTLTWEAPTAGVGHNRIHHYEIERRTPPGDGNGGTWTQRSTPADPGGGDAPTRWTDPDDLFATAAIAYEYRVRAVIEDAYGNRLSSDWSTEAAVTLAPPPLGAPTGLVAEPDVFGKVALDWRAPTDRGGAEHIDGYLVERRTPPGDGNGGTWTAVLTPGRPPRPRPPAGRTRRPSPRAPYTSTGCAPASPCRVPPGCPTGPTE